MHCVEPFETVDGHQYTFLFAFDAARISPLYNVCMLGFCKIIGSIKSHTLQVSESELLVVVGGGVGAVVMRAAGMCLFNQ